MSNEMAFYQGGDRVQKKQDAVLIWTLIALIAAGGWRGAYAAEEDTSVLSAKLPNGVRVELLGVTVHNAVRAGRSVWWAPDGTPMETGPYFKPQRSCSGPFPGELIREFACRISGLEGYDATARTSLGDAAVDLWTVLNEENKTIVGPLRSCVCRFKDGTSVGTFRIGITTAAWQTIEQWKDTRWHTFDPDDTVVGESANPLVLNCPRQNGRRVILEIAHTYIEEARRFVITDRDGKTYANELSTYGRGKGLVFEKAEFWDIKLEDVVLIEFQTRPYQWVEFSNISLVPETETKPQVRILPAPSAKSDEQNAAVIEPEEKKAGLQPLPISSLDIEISPQTLKGKMLLLCFWDFNQRPSRHCITELAKEAPRLAGRGVITAAVQIGPAAEKDVRKWMQESEIDLPAGSAKPEAAEQIRLKWDIKSLPWLVLTDSEPKPIVKGFKVSDIEQVIKGEWACSEAISTGSKKPASNSISGRVLDAEGKPVEGAMLRVYPGGQDLVRSDWQGRFELSSHLHPDYSSLSLNEREKYLVVRYPDENLAAVVDLRGAAIPENITLSQGAALVGKVVDANGCGIQSAQAPVMIRGKGWGSSITRPNEWNVSDDGTFEIKAIPPGYPHSIEAEAAGYGQKSLMIDANEVIAGRVGVGEIKLKRANLSVSGIVLDEAGNPVTRAKIIGFGDGQNHMTTETELDGTFLLEGACEGPITLRSYALTDKVAMNGTVETTGGAREVRLILIEE